MTKTEKIAWLFIFIIILEIMPKEENKMNFPSSHSLENRELS